MSSTYSPGHKRDWYSMPLIVALILFSSAACDTQVFVRDGVTDGSSFSIPAKAAQRQDRVTQSWIAYSLARSACQIAMGGDNPARNHSFDCEYRARKVLLESWRRRNNGKSGDQNDQPIAEGNIASNRYLSELSEVEKAGYLPEYVWAQLRRRSWQASGRMALAEYNAWQKKNLVNHRVQTRLIGSWSFPPSPDG